MVGKNGDAFAVIYEENGTAAGNGPDHKMRCLGVLRALRVQL
jgi:hypothetical protein